MYNYKNMKKNIFIKKWFSISNKINFNAFSVCKIEKNFHNILLLKNKYILLKKGINRLKCLKKHLQL